MAPEKQWMVLWLTYIIACIVALEARSVRIAGCTRYGSEGLCTACARQYELTSEGNCNCAKGFVRPASSTRACVPVAGPCTGKCGATYLDNGQGGFCHCDYYCDNLGDCCGGTASKRANCPAMIPSLNKPRITNCTNPVGVTNRTYGFKPGQCWCDKSCKAAGDCCPACNNSSCSSESAKSLNPEPSTVVIQNDGPSSTDDNHNVEITAQRIQHSDCGIVGQRLKAAMATIASTANANWETAAEAVMQKCQAEDTGAPADPYVMAVHWTAARVCDRRGTDCYGGDYSVELVQKQIDYLNVMFERTGIQFTWDKVIHQATATSMAQIDDYAWVCQLQRYDEGMTVHVVTAPKHLGGALGYTNYWSSYSQGFGQTAACYNWVHIYEKTLPDQGARSLVDGGLSDSGAVLAHEIGHQLMLHHTWFEPTWEQQPISAQCRASASMAYNDVVASRSDGVRDTTAQSLNATGEIIRFVNCDRETGAYTNTSAFAQQSCNSAVQFAQGNAYYNNYNNLMSYGDKTCLRTLTPGQGARARCAIKCMIQLAC